MDAKIIDALTKVGLCASGLRYAAQYDTPQEAWDACEDPDSLLWVLGRFGWRHNLKGILELANKWAAAAAAAAGDASCAAGEARNAAGHCAYYIQSKDASDAILSTRAAADASSCAYFADPKTTYADQCDDIRRLFQYPPKIA